MSIDASHVAVVVVTVVAIYAIAAATAFVVVAAAEKKTFEKLNLIDCTVSGEVTWRWSCRGRDEHQTHGCLQLKHSLAKQIKSY